MPDGLEILDRGHSTGKGWDCTESIRGGAGSQLGQTSGLVRGVDWQEDPCGEGSGLEGEEGEEEEPRRAAWWCFREKDPPQPPLFIHIKLGLFPFICLTLQPRCC